MEGRGVMGSWDVGPLVSDRGKGRQLKYKSIAEARNFGCGMRRGARILRGCWIANDALFQQGSKKNRKTRWF